MDWGVRPRRVVRGGSASRRATSGDFDRASQPRICGRFTPLRHRGPGRRHRGGPAAVGVERATVVGYSMGGAVAQALAHRHPGGRPSRAHRCVRRASPAWRIARQFGTYLVRAWERLTGLGTPEVRAGYLILTGAVAPIRPLDVGGDPPPRHRRRRGGVAGLDAVRRVRVAREHRRPTLVIVPTRDQLVPPRWQYALGSMIPRARIVDIAGGRHELPWTHPERVATRSNVS
jgi:pimeloyl-ACP methyl ester carboxylesterase